MHDVLGVTVVDCLEQTLHVSSSDSLRESLVSLLRDLLEELLTGDVLHDQVDVLLVVVGLVVLDDVRVVQRVQDRDLLHDAVNVVAQLYLVEHFDRHLEVFVMLIRGQKDAAEGANTEHLCLRVNVVILFKLMHTLLFITLTRLNIRSLDSSLGRSAVLGLCGVEAAHSNKDFRFQNLKFAIYYFFKVFNAQV